MRFNFVGNITQIKTIAFLVLTILLSITTLLTNAPYVSATEKDSQYAQTEADFKLNLEETYTKFINENNSKEIAYLNYNESYYSVTILKENGETFQITQKKIENTWVYETLECEKQQQGKEEVICSQKTSNNDWQSHSKEDLKNSIAALMLEPITITSYIIGDYKPVNAEMTYTIEPGRNQNIYLNSYTSENAKGQLRQEISVNTYALKLKQEKPFVTYNTVIINTY